VSGRAPGFTHPPFPPAKIAPTYAELLAEAAHLRYLVGAAYERFTDNDMQPPNTELARWLEQARKAITR